MSAPANTYAQAPLRPIRQLRNTRDAFRFLLRKAQLPMPVTAALVKGAKYVWNPSQVALRARVARDVGINAEARQIREKGFILFDKGRFPDFDRTIGACRSAFEQSGAAAWNLDELNKNFLINAVKDEELLDWPEIFEFASSRQLIDIATGYFGSVPLLSGASLWWTPPNDSLTQSQLFHCDRMDRAVLKMFFNVHDIDGDMGPFCLIPADVSERIRAEIAYERRKSSRVSDEEIEAHGGMEHKIALEGPEGSGACIDTYRCLHYGSRANTKSRLVLMIRFAECLAPYADIPNWYEGLRDRDYVLDEVQRLALGIRP